ncbi:ABC transporter permease subunit [Intrasporangium sp.]|uniref:ABC transporter permease n=1 Tax=Intrasporangium sp. TaxID=1925024 RepID=UPI0032221959
MDWFTAHAGEVWPFFVEHLYLSGVPLLIGLAIALPLGWVAKRYRFLGPPLIMGTGLLYTLPSLAVFILLPGILHTQILDPVNVIVAMTVYTVALLVRTVADGLHAVPEDVLLSATAMGYRPFARLVKIELPLAVPVISAGLRVAAVSNVSIVSVAAIIGVEQLGSLFTDGFNRAFFAPIITGIVACVVLSLLLDLLIMGVTHLLTPWARTRRPT